MGLGVTIVNESHILTAHPEICMLPLGHVPTVQKGFIWRQDTENPLVSAAPNALEHVIEAVLV